MKWTLAHGPDVENVTAQEQASPLLDEFTPDAPEQTAPVDGLLSRSRSKARSLDWTVIGLIVLAMIVGGALRLYDIGELPRGFNQDEAVYSYDAWSISQSGRDHLGHPVNFVGIESYGDWTPPLQTISLVPAAAVFGLDVAALRSWNALLALMAVPLMYLVANALFGNRAVAMLAAWLLAVVPWHVIQSRVIFPAAIVPAVIALLMLALVMTAKLQSRYWLIATALIAGAGLSTYQALRGYVPMLLAAAAIAWWRRYWALGPGSLALAGLIFSLIALPIVTFMFFDTAGSKRMEEVSVFNENSFYLPEGTVVDAMFVVEQYLDYFGPAFLVVEGGEYYPWILPRNVGAIPAVLAASLALGAVMLVVRIVRPRTPWQRSVAVFLLIALLCYPIPGAISAPSPAAVRGMHGLPVMVLVALFGLFELWNLVLGVPGRVTARTRKIGLAVAGALLAVGLIAQSAQHLDRYFSKYADETSYDYHYGIDGALDFAVRNQSIYNEIWVAHVNEPYIYLLFGQEIDPAEARQKMTIRRAPGDYNWITSYENFRFTSRNVVDPPAELDIESMPTVYQSFYPNGEVAYEVRAGDVPGYGLMMVIFRPQLLGAD